MCGICGIIGEPNSYLLKLICNNLVHRGPDSEGYYIDDKVALGVRRLRIIDLVTGDQPIHNEDSTIWVVFNGEIYNFLELKSKLQAKHRFYTSTDTEVLVHLWEDYKENMLGYLKGMFAFAIYDAKENKVFIARDRFGEKPLYYTIIDNSFIFASELKALIKVLERIEINTNALASYFAFFYNHLEESFIKNVFRLNPSSYILYDIKNRKFEIKKYWDLNIDENIEISIEDALKLLDRYLSNSVKNCLISDVPLGILLSGGVDSSIIASLASKNARIKTFHITSEEEEEVKFAEEIANLIGSEHKTIYIDKNFMKNFDDIAYSIDEPVADPSILLSYYICETTRKHVTVALTGEGGDELFWGYPWISLNDGLDKWFDLPSFIRKNALKMRYITKHINSSYAGILQDIARYEKIGYHSLDSVGKRIARLSHFSLEEIKNLLATRFEDPYKEYEEILRKRNSLRGSAYLTIKKVLPNDFLHKDDRMSMKHSLELRAPFLDHELFQAMYRISDSYKLNSSTQKYLLKLYAVKYLKMPKEAIFRKKVGFSMPLNRYHKDFIYKKKN